MSGYIESEAVFKQRCSEIGLSVAQHLSLVSASYSTMGRFAYGCSYVPGAPDDAALIGMIDRICEGHPDEGVVGLFRRLYFESFTMVQSDLKLRLERSDEAPLRKLAVPERSARYDKQVLKLSSLVLTGELECADCLVDETIRQFDENRVRYIRWERCLKKDAEEDNVRKSSSLDATIQGLVRVTTVSTPGDADTSSELLLRFAMTRRGLAYDQANLLEFSLHEAWVTKMFTFRLRADIPHHARVSLDQLLNGDRALFSKLAQMTRSGIVPTAAGVRPLDVAFPIAMADAEVLQLFAALALPAHADKRPAELPADRSKADKKQRSESKGSGKGKGDKKKRDKGSGKGQKRPPPALPAGIEGSSVTPDGSHICFGYSQGKCDQALPGRGCSFGKHVCTICFGPHSFLEHGKPR